MDLDGIFGSMAQGETLRDYRAREVEWIKDNACPGCGRLDCDGSCNID